MTTAEAAKRAKAALRRAFPQCKFSVTSGYSRIDIVWTDDGPTLDQVRQMLVDTGCAIVERGWDDTPHLYADGDYFSFDRYNVAQRVAEAQEREQRRQEYEIRERHAAEVVSQAHKAKYAAIEPLKNDYTSQPITDNSVFEAFERLRQRAESGAWRFGPREWSPPYDSSKKRKWELLISQREQAPTLYRDQALEARLAELTRQIEAIDAEDLTKAKAFYDRQRLRQRALELARARVLDFVGAPDVQMQLAARLCGPCCVCWKVLTDPLSLERGIGPDCYQHKIEHICELAKRGRDIRAINFLTGMPIGFIAEVLSEANSAREATPFVSEERQP